MTPPEGDDFQWCTLRMEISVGWIGSSGVVYSLGSALPGVGDREHTGVTVCLSEGTAFGGINPDAVAGRSRIFAYSNATGPPLYDTGVVSTFPGVCDNAGL